METLNYNKDDIANMLCLDSTIYQIFNEGKIYIDGDVAIKQIRNNNGTYFSNKLFTINSLVDRNESIGMPELVMPKALVSIEKTIVGFAMPYIKGCTMAETLTREIALAQKIDYLKQVGTILRKMAEVRKVVDDFYLNDLHERNLIVDEFGRVNVIDLDSCSIDHNLKFRSKYLSKYNVLLKNDKYQKVGGASCGATIVPDANTDLFCYSVIFLNFLFDMNVQGVNKNYYLKLMNRLLDAKAPKELVDGLSKLMSPEDNFNFDYLLDSVPEFYSNIRTRGKK